jgi:hypothetical protein
MARRAKKSSRQIDEFRKAARAPGCDESEERFRNALRTVARQKPKRAASEKSPKSHRN